MCCDYATTCGAEARGAVACKRFRHIQCVHSLRTFNSQGRGSKAGLKKLNFATFACCASYIACVFAGPMDAGAMCMPGAVDLVQRWLSVLCIVAHCFAPILCVQVKSP